ncbi:MAG: hypothetical protein VB144_08695 [Clostridia bacterium]|nr:hypothetical protein [Clostridia bacterium]
MNARGNRGDNFWRFSGHLMRIPMKSVVHDVRLLIVRVLSFLGVLASLVWVLLPNGEYDFQWRWDRVILFLTALTAFVGSEGADIRRSARRSHPRDVTLADEFFKALPPGGTVRFLRVHDFGGTFRRHDTEQLFRFIHDWDEPDKEFIDTVIERRRKELLRTGKELHGSIGEYTFTFLDDRQSVAPKVPQDRPRSESDIRRAEALNEAATRFVEKYDEFCRLVRRRIHE